MKITWAPGSDPYFVVKKAVLDKFGWDYTDNYIVELKIRFSGDSEYQDITVLMLDNRESSSDPANYEWSDDWWEGQTDILLVGAAPVCDVDLEAYWKFDE